VVDRGSVEVVRTATADVPAATVAAVDAGGFVGELNLLTGQNVYLLGRVREGGRVYRVPPERLRQLMASDVELSDIVFKALIARRELLQRSTAALAVEIVGTDRSAAALALRTYAARQRLIHLWFDADTPAGRTMMESSGLTADDLPAVVMPGVTLKRTTPGELAEKLGLSYRRSSTKPVDVAIVGAGPAGLAAAVYAASEGLKTVVLEGYAPGGQAGSSSLIENFFGFPTGISGSDLTYRAQLQAYRFGAKFSTPARALSLDHVADDEYRACLQIEGCGATLRAKCLIIATGADYGRLQAEGRAEFEGSGVYYAATALEGQICRNETVVVVGGGNSAGQAAMFLSDGAAKVLLVIRGDDLSKGMSDYLSRRVQATQNIEILRRTEIRKMTGRKMLEGVELENIDTGERHIIKTPAVFSMIGAKPCTDWLPRGIERDEKGFIKTGHAVADAPAWKGSKRAPGPLETSLPGVFAAGDVRSGSVKRCAAAVGEGGMAIAGVQDVLGTFARTRAK
jgi:thioredoxin reductase (NADPH)